MNLWHLLIAQSPNLELLEVAVSSSTRPLHLQLIQLLKQIDAPELQLGCPLSSRQFQRRLSNAGEGAEEPSGKSVTFTLVSPAGACGASRIHF